MTSQTKQKMPSKLGLQYTASHAVNDAKRVIAVFPI